jgi:hypothetical protein
MCDKRKAEDAAVAATRGRLGGRGALDENKILDRVRLLR